MILLFTMVAEIGWSVVKVFVVIGLILFVLG